MTTRTRGWDGKVPFDPITGSQQSYPEHRYRRSSARLDGGPPAYEPLKPVWRDNYVFRARLSFLRVSRGRSAANFVVSDGEREYTMFLSDALAVIQETGVLAGGVTPPLKWTFRKQGANYGVRRA